MINPLHSLKEAAAEAAITALVNREIETFGTVRSLSINTEQKTMRVELALKGEAARIWINVAAYELSEQNGQVHIAFQNATASREWITAVLNQYVVGRPFRLPNAARVLL